MRQTGVVVWQQVAARIQRDISDETFDRSKRLPNEQELAQRYGVNRHTLRQAIGSLAEQGILDVRQGKGTFLRQEGLSYPLNSRTRFTENMSRNAIRASGRLIRVDYSVATAEIADFMCVPEGARLLMLEILHLGNNQPITLAEHYFPVPRFERMGELFKKEGSVTKALKSFGIDDYRRKKTRLVARLPTIREAGLLKQARSQPIVSIRYINVDQNGGPIELGVSRFSADRVQFVLDD